MQIQADSLSLAADLRRYVVSGRAERRPRDDPLVPQQARLTGPTSRSH